MIKSHPHTVDLLCGFPIHAEKIVYEGGLLLLVHLVTKLLEFFVISIHTCCLLREKDPFKTHTP